MAGYSRIILLLLILLAGVSARAISAVIPYPNAGTANTEVYSFTAANSGDVIAYFAGSTAGYTELVGMYINGVLSSAGFGLNNHLSSVGDTFNMGTVTSGDILTFAISIISPDLGIVYSDPSLNTTYDNGNNYNHIYTTSYTSGLIAGLPTTLTGIYVAFEDLPYGSSNYNYYDETYVFTNVASNTPIAPTPEPGTMLLMGIGVAGVAFMRRRKVKSEV